MRRPHRALPLALALGFALTAPVPAVGAARPAGCSSNFCSYEIGEREKTEPRGEFFGQEAAVAHPFSRESVRTFRAGKYVDYDMGLTYEGEFSYIPTYNNSLSSGVYIFQGVRIDDEADEVIRGLFVSREIFPDHPAIFSRARPDYLVKLKQDFETAQSKFAADSQARAVARENERQSRENFGSLLGVMGGLLAVGSMGSVTKGMGNAGNIGGLIGNLGGGGGMGAIGGVAAMGALGGGKNAGLGNLQSASLAALTDGILGRKSSADVLTGVVTMVAQQALQGKDAGLAGGQADPAGGLIASLGQLAQSNTPMTRKQYAAQLVGAAVAGVTQPPPQALAAPAPRQAPAPASFPVIATAPPAAGTMPASSDSSGRSAPTADVAPAAMPLPAPAPLAPNVMPASSYRPDAPTATDPVGANSATTLAAIGARPVPPAPAMASGGMPVSAYIAAGAPVAQTPAAPPTKQRLATSQSTASAIVKTTTGPGEKLAQIDKVAPPAGLTVRGTHLFATNDGLYLALEDAGGGMVAGKRLIARQGSDGWLKASLPKGGMNFSPTSLRPESHQEFSIAWTSIAGQFGTINMNNGGTQSTYEDDRRTQRWVPIGAQSTSPRQWVVASEGKVFLKASGGGKDTKFSANYDPVATPVAVMSTLSATDEEGSTLYAAEAGLRGLVAVTMNGTVERFDLSSFGEGMVHTLIAGHGRMWVGYGQHILTIRNGQIQPFARLSMALPGAGPQFCLSGTTMYTADGRVIRGINISPADPKDFLNLAKANSPKDMLLAAQARSALLLGIHCARNPEFGDLLFAVGPNLEAGGLELLEIRPGG